MLNADNTICIVGTGACTSVGLQAATTAAGIRAGLSGFAEHPYQVDRYGEPIVVARVPSLLTEKSAAERISALIPKALQESLTTLAHRSLPAIPLKLGLPEARPGLAENDVARIGETLVAEQREVS